MPTFREVNTGQIVNVGPEQVKWFESQARWVTYGDESPQVAKAKDAETAHAAPAPGDDMPGKDADRDDWIAYALNHGHTAEDMKGVRTTTIRSWFTD